MTLWSRLCAWVARLRRKAPRCYDCHTTRPGLVLRYGIGSKTFPHWVCPPCLRARFRSPTQSEPKFPTPAHMNVRQEDLDALQEDWDALYRDGHVSRGESESP